MMPFDFSVRSVVLKYSPRLTEEKFDILESAMTQKHQLGQLSHLRLAPFHFFTHNELAPSADLEELKSQLKKTIEKNNLAMEKFLEEYKKPYLSAYRLFVARKQYAVHQRYLLQIPTSIRALRAFIVAAFNFRVVQISEEPRLWWAYIKDLFRKKNKNDSQFHADKQDGLSREQEGSKS